MATILITGANRGIGLALAGAFATRGDRVIATCRDPQRADMLQALAVDPATDLRIYAMDVTAPRTIQAARDAIGETTIDVLINNAGIIGPARQSTLDMDFDGFAHTLAVNTIGPLRVVHAFLPNLRRSKAARILTITSRMGSFTSAATDRIAYRASKAAVNRVMQALAADLAGQGIAVALVHPGWVRTDMGGPRATISVEESVAGLVAIADRLDMGGTGRFLDVDGREIGW